MRILIKVAPILVTIAFKHFEDLGKETNERICIGPGRDGSADDKVAVDLKFAPTNTKATSHKMSKEQGYVKTTFVLVVDPHRAEVEESELWTLVG